MKLARLVGLALAALGSASAGRPGPAQVVYVDDDATGANDGTSWEDAYVDLVDAIHFGSTLEVWVAAGTYRPAPPGGHRDLEFHLTDQAVYGGFAGFESSLEQRAGFFDQTILSGDLLGDDGPGFTNVEDNSYTVLQGGGNFVLDGFTIEGGNAEGFGNNRFGGGAHLFEDAGPYLVRNCVFRRNRAMQQGGGVYSVTSGSDAREGATPSRFVDCDFIGNEAGAGGGLNSLSRLELVGCRFLGNRSTVEGGGGARFENFLEPSRIINGLFSGNAGETGGGGLDVLGDLDVVNSTFSRNAAVDATDGGGLRYRFGGGNLVNSVLWGNAGSGSLEAQQLAQSESTVVIQNTCLEGWTGTLGGPNNHGLDPLFVDSDGADGVVGTLDDDLRLGPGSRAVDAGSDALLPADDLDLDGDADLAEVLSLDGAGRPRQRDGDADGSSVVDMGAHERPTTDFAGGVDDGETVTLDPGEPSREPTDGALVTFTNTSGTDNAVVAASEDDAGIATGVGAFGVSSAVVDVTTSLFDGKFAMTVSVPFAPADLGGADPLLLDLAYFDVDAGVWTLAVSGNTQDSPGQSGPVGDRFAVSAAGVPDPRFPSAELGDYGVFWDPVAQLGYAWANVDHTTEFAASASPITAYGCGVNPVGSLVASSGSPAVGQVLTLGVDDPTGSSPPGSVAFVAASLAPDPGFPCGTSLPSFGFTGGAAELLVSFAPPNPVAVLTGQTWSAPGGPALVPLAVPPSAALAGLELFLQGGLAAPSKTSLAGALTLRLGP